MEASSTNGNGSRAEAGNGFSPVPLGSKDYIDLVDRELRGDRSLTSILGADSQRWVSALKQILSDIDAQISSRRSEIDNLRALSTPSDLKSCRAYADAAAAYRDWRPGVLAFRRSVDKRRHEVSATERTEARPSTNQSLYPVLAEIRDLLGDVLSELRAQNHNNKTKEK